MKMHFTKCILAFLFVIVSVSHAQTIDTVIIVNGGDKSTIDAAIAASISYDTGIPVLYTDYRDASVDVVRELQSGEYKDVTNVVIIGGPAVVSGSAQDSLEAVGETSGFDVTRIAGATGTGTAVEAIKYFYGPGVLDEVTLVKYSGDYDKAYGDELALSAQLGKPIIPVPEDVEGLPADVADMMDRNVIDRINIIGDFAADSEIKGDLSELKIKVASEIDGDRQEVERKLEIEVENKVKPGDGIIFVEEGEVPPILPDHEVFFYRDENNDNIDDDTGSVLDAIGRGLVDRLGKQGKNIEEFKFFSDNDGVQEKFRREMEKAGIQVALGKPDDAAGTAVRFTKQEADGIKKYFEKRDDALRTKFEEHKELFEEKLSDTVEQFKAFYTAEKDKLSPEALEIGAKIIDESSKGDARAQWGLMQAFANAHRYDGYIKCDAQCMQQQIELEKAGVDKKLETLVGTDRAREVANLDAGKKLGLFKSKDFIAPGEKEKFQKEMQAAWESGKSPEEIYRKYVEERKDNAYDVYVERAKEEYQALKSGEDPSKWTPEQIKAKYEERLSHESDAYLSGLIKPEDYADASKRAEVYRTIENVDRTLESKGIKDTHYLTPDEWKQAYDKYKSEGTISDADAKQYEAAVTAYKTYEISHYGDYVEPIGGKYDAKTGQFGYVDPATNSYVGGAYDSSKGTYTYTNEQGELVQATKYGYVFEYTKDSLPTGYKYDEKAGTYSYGKTVYTPPVTGGEYNKDAGVYAGGTYNYVDPSTGETKNYVPPSTAAGYSGSYIPPGSTYTYTDSSGKTYTSTSESVTYSDPRTGQTYAEGSYTGGTYTSGGGDTGGFTQTYTGGTTGGTSTGSTGGTTYTGGTYTGGTSGGDTGGSTGGYTGGSYSGGSTGGDTGGYSAPSGGGDSGGGTSGGYSAPSG